jgi:hypothetical protein
VRIAAGQPGLYGPFWARPGLFGSGVLRQLCPVDDRSSAVEVGSSCAVVALLFRAPAMSCTSIVQVSHQWPRRDGDGDFKTVVARARGR